MNSNLFKLNAVFASGKYMEFLQGMGFKIINHDVHDLNDYYVEINSLEDLAKLQQAADNLSHDLKLEPWGLIINFNDDFSKTKKSIEIYNFWNE